MHNCAKGDLRAQVLSATPGAKASPDQMVPRPHPGGSWTVLRRERRLGGSPRIDSCEKTISSHYLFISIFICHQTAFQIKINMTDSYSECGFEENCLCWTLTRLSTLYFILIWVVGGRQLNIGSIICQPCFPNPVPNRSVRENSDWCPTSLVFTCWSSCTSFWAGQGSNDPSPPENPKLGLLWEVVWLALTITWIALMWYYKRRINITTEIWETTSLRMIPLSFAL